VTSYDYDLGYDPIGRRETYTDAGTQTEYTRNSLNQYTRISTLTDPTYNADGNMTYLPSWTGNWDLTWNAENRLVKAVSPGTKLEFTYDYKGRRIQKQVYQRDTTTDDWSLPEDHSSTGLSTYYVTYNTNEYTFN